MRLAVVDTNVVVAGLLTSDPGAPTSRIVDSMLSGELRFAVSIDLLAEYREVLLRPRIQGRHGLSTEEVDAVLEAIARNAVVATPGRSIDSSPDPGDQHLWDLLDGFPAAVLVTGDELLRGSQSGERALSPRELLELDREA